MATGMVDIDRGWKAIRAEMENMRGASALVGIFDGVSVAREDGSPALIAEYAAYNEFGTERIPERPWMRQCLDRHGPEYEADLAAGQERIVTGKATTRQVLTALAVKLQRHLKESITRGDFAPLAESTLERRRDRGNVSTKPLIDTGAMRNAVQWEVRDGQGTKKAGNTA